MCHCERSEAICQTLTVLLLSGLTTKIGQKEGLLKARKIASLRSQRHSLS